MKQINQLGIEITTPSNDDLIPIQQANGTTGRITRENFLNENVAVELSLNTLVYRDTNWHLATRVNRFAARETLLWTSFGPDSTGADSLIGTLKIGYLRLKNKLHIALAGGGLTSPSLKSFKLARKSDNSIILSLTLGQILGVDTNLLIYKEIDTSSIANEEVYLQLEDNATNAFGWIAFSPSIFVE